MVTVEWNIKLLGNLTERDVDRWISAAGIPTGYHFTISRQDAKRDAKSYYEQEGQGATVIVPEENNTIVVTGGEGVVDFKPYCYPGNKCIMMAQKTDFATGTELFSLILTCDGFLDKNALNSVMDTVPLGDWIKKNQPSALNAFNNIDNLTTADGYINEDTTDGVKLKNAICQYITKVLGLWNKKTTTTTTQTQNPSETQTQNPSTTTVMTIPQNYLLGAGVIGASIMGYLIYKKMKTQ